MQKVKRSSFGTQQQLMSAGKLTVLALALGGALAAMTAAHAQTTISTAVTTEQSWTNSNLTITGTGSVAVTSGVAINALVTSGALINSGTITGGTGIYNGTIGTIGTIGSLINNGVITTTGDSIDNHGTITSLTNTNLISGGGTFSGIYNASTGSIGTLNNTSGTISGGGFGIANNGTVDTLNNSAVISGVEAIKNLGTIGTLTNSGLITASGTNSDGVYNYGTIGTIGVINALNNTIGGTINALENGVLNSGIIGSLNNSGLISATSGNSVGIYNANGVGSTATITTLTNSGTISAGEDGVDNLGTIGTLTNSGVISASGTFSSSGVFNAGSISSFSNTGVISGVDGVTNNGSIGTLTNGNGTISGIGNGVYNVGTIGALSNSGLISASTANSVGVYNYGSNGIIGTISSLNNTIGAIISGVEDGISNHGLITSLSNSGLIDSTSGTFGDGIYNTGTIGSLINNSNGTISGFNAGIVNSGTIGGTAVGIALNNIGSISSLSNSGIITGNSTGISNSGRIGVLSNSGIINGAGTAGISNSGSIGVLSNSGTISGYSGIGNSGTIATLVNTGVISGSYLAISNASAQSSIGTISNSGVIAGNIYNASGNALTIGGGTGSSFGTLTGYSGSIGTIGNYNSNVVFSSGNQLLNDNINLGTITGSDTVSVLAGTLQVNNHVTISGNYSQASAATLSSGVSNTTTTNGVNADTGYGRLYVTGNSTIAAGAGVSLTALNATYGLAQGQRYVVLQTAGTATYNASALNYSASGFNVSGASVADSTNTGSTDLVLTVGSAITSAAATSGTTYVLNTVSNPAAAASLTGLFNYSGTNAGLLNVLDSAAALGSAAAINKAGAQLSPTAVSGAAVQASGAAGQAVSSVATSHLDSIRTAQADGNGNSGVATGEYSYDPSVWGQVFGGHAGQSERDNIAGYNANYTGLLLGADAQVTEQVRAGGLFSYAKTNMSNTGDNTGTSATVDTFGLSAYASYTGDPWYVNLLAGVAQQQYATSRAISYTGFSGVANGSFNGIQYSTTAQAGYPLNVEQWLPGVSVTPLAGLSYSTLRENGYSETGGNGAGLTMNASDSNSLKSELAVKAETTLDSSYGKLTPLLQVGWHHEFHDTRTQSTAGFVDDTSGSSNFVTQGAKPISDTGVLALGVTLLESKNLKVAARYTVEAGSGYVGQTADVQVRWQY